MVGAVTRGCGQLRVDKQDNVVISVPREVAGSTLYRVWMFWSGPAVVGVTAKMTEKKIIFPEGPQGRKAFLMI